MDELEIGKNTGFIAVEPTDTDFIAGGETGILDTVINPTLDWRPYLPTNVTQLMKDSHGTALCDTNACVSFAAKQNVETLLNFLKINRHLALEDVEWLASKGYIDENGKILFSARFTAKMSGTDPHIGNSLPRVWDSIRNKGMVPDSVWPMPTTDIEALVAAGKTSNEDLWALYYKDIPQEVINLALEFQARFEVLYEWIVTLALPASESILASYLGVAPLEIATAVCPGWNTDNPIKGCGIGSGHATLLSCVENDRYDILDHYVPYQKQFASNYTISYAMRGVIRRRVGKPTPAVPIYIFTKQMTYGSSQNDPIELKALQDALQYLKRSNGLPYMKVGLYGPFGPQTKAALGLFQTDHGITDPNGQGVDFGPVTRAALNAALNAK